LQPLGEIKTDSGPVPELDKIFLEALTNNLKRSEELMALTNHPASPDLATNIDHLGNLVTAAKGEERTCQIRYTLLIGRLGFFGTIGEPSIRRLIFLDVFFPGVLHLPLILLNL
jgi:hypothetical protein